jgi:hypothetical protein
MFFSKKLLGLTFGSLFILELATLIHFFFPFFEEWWGRGDFFLWLMLLSFILGLFLLFLVAKRKIKGKQKTFLILTGASAGGLFFFSILHNLFYALGSLKINFPGWTSLMEVFSLISFLLAVLISPFGFLVGSLMSIYFFIKLKR